VSAEHDDDAALALGGGGQRVDDGAEVTRDEDVGERIEKCAERAIVAGRMRELGRAYLVRAPGDGNRADSREVRFAIR